MLWYYSFTKLAEYYCVTIDELLGYKPIISINNIYIDLHSFITRIEDDGERMDAVYRICRLAGELTSKKGSDKAQELIEGKYGNNSSILQAYGEDYGGVLSHDINSMLVSSFKNIEKIEVSKIREFYKALSSLSNMNVLKVLVAFFENHNNSNVYNGMTVNELSSKTNLTVDEVYEAMNHLDVKTNNNTKEERWFIMHTDTIPLLMLLTQGKKSFRGDK